MKMKKIIILILICFLSSCSKKYICDTGQLVEDKCLITETKEVLKSCPNGYELDEERNQCISKMIIAAKPNYQCREGFYLGDSICVSEQIFAQQLERQCVSNNIKEGDTLSTTEEREGSCYEKICIEVAEDNTCKTYEEHQIDFQVKWSCPEGTRQIDGECHQVGYLGRNYSCELGTLEDKNCVIEKTADVTISCENGYTYNEENNNCERKVYEDAYLK